MFPVWECGNRATVPQPHRQNTRPAVTGPVAWGAENVPDAGAQLAQGQRAVGRLCFAIGHH